MRNSNGLLIVYDACNSQSFEKVDYWLKLSRQHLGEECSIYLLGNKSDLIKKNSKNRKVSLDIVSKYVIENNIDYWTECSALENENLQDTFVKFYLDIYKKQKKLLENSTKSFTKVYQTRENSYTKSNECC